MFHFGLLMPAFLHRSLMIVFDKRRILPLLSNKILTNQREVSFNFRHNIFSREGQVPQYNHQVSL